MSVLVLDHTQRLNLHVMIGMQRANLDDMRMFWRIQDRIELSNEEKEAIGYQVRTAQTQNGPVPQIAWDPSRWLAPKEYEFAPEEVAKLQNLIKTWQQGYQIGGDRVWLEPLLPQLENGSGPTQQDQIQPRHQ